MCRVSRKALVLVWSLQKQQTSPLNKGSLAFPEFIGRLHPYCTEHHAALDLVNGGTEYIPEEQTVCPRRSDELTSTQKLYLEKWMAEEALELEIVAR